MSITTLARHIGKNAAALILTLAFSLQVYAQKQGPDLYFKKNINTNAPNIYYLSFSELLNLSKELAGKFVEVHGFCADNEQGKFVVYQNKEASDNLVERESIALKYSKEDYNFDFHLSEPEYIKSIDFFKNKYCEILGRYGGSELENDGTIIPPHGYIEVISLRGGKSRK